MTSAAWNSVIPGLRLLRAALSVVLLVVITGWVLDIPATYLGQYYYNEQFLALAAGLAVAIVLLEGNTAERSGRFILANTVFAGWVLALFLYVTARFPALQLEVASAPIEAVVLGFFMILGVMESVRRKTGWFLPCLILFLIGFAFVGPHLPAVYQTRPVSFSRIMVYLSLDTNALLSQILAIAAIVVAPFIVFGYLLNNFGGSAVFSDIAARAVGKYKGGPAKVSVVGSGAFGMVSGSAVANVVAVGSVTIPTMVRAGYSRPVAGAIEAVASTGGQLIPPIMGASAFLMAELLQIPYRDVALAAVFPSLLFYLALLLSVDFEARRLDIKGDPNLSLDLDDEGTDQAAKRHRWRYLLPAAVLIYFLFWRNMSPEISGIYSTAALLIVHFTWPWYGLWNRIKGAGKGLIDAMGPISDIIVLAGAAGLVIGILNLTGVAFAITLQMLAISGGVLGILLLLTAILSIILGLGMPTVGVYVLLATLAAPALIQLGIVPLAAHMYVLYFGMLSMITPPIAIASFAAASVAQTSPWKTAFASLKVGAGVYLVPIAFVLQPELLMLGNASDLLVATARCALAIAVFSAAAVGHVARPINLPLRGLLAILAFAGVLPMGSAIPDMVLWLGSGAGAALLLWLCWPGARNAQAATETHS